MALIHSSLDNVILKEVSSTFEGMAFSVVTRSSDNLDLDCELQWSLLNIVKPIEGSLMIIMPVKLAVTLAENMLGVEGDELKEEMITDALAEVLNTLVGRIMAIITDSQEVFELGIPENGIGCPDMPAGENFDADYSVFGETFKLVLNGSEIIAHDVEEEDDSDVDTDDNSADDDAGGW